MREAGEGLESRLRARAKKEIHVKTGVSASGKGVTVGSAVKESGKAVKKKDKDKAKPSDVEIVSTFPDHLEITMDCIPVDPLASQTKTFARLVEE